MRTFNINRVHLAILAIILIFINISEAQFEKFHESWRWAHFTTKTGLPSDIVEDVIETDDGTVWVSTSKGVAWYDGFRWHPIDSTKGLELKQPKMIANGRNNEVLVIINSQLFIGGKEGFTKAFIPNENFEPTVSSACVYDSSSLLICASSETTFIYNDQSKFYSLYNEDRYFSVWRSRIGNIWGLSDSGFRKMENGVWSSSLLNAFVTAVSENKNGEGVLVVNSPKEKIGIWEWNKNNVVRYSKTERGLQLRSIDISPNNDVVAAYESGEIRIRQNGKWKFLENLPYEISEILFVKFRNTEDVWIGTENGLFLFRYSTTQWTRWIHPFTDKRNIVMEIFKTKTGDIWIGTINGIEIRSINGQKKYVTHVNNTRLGLITGINEDNNGRVWICSGSSFEGAYRWDGKNWKHFGNTDGLGNINIHKIRKNQSGQLLFLGLGRAFEKDSLYPGVFIYDNGKFHQFRINGGPLNNRVYSYVETNLGAHWFGSRGGISRFNKGVWKHWGSEVGIKYAYTITNDLENNIWFSNFNSNLGYISPDDSVHWIKSDNIGFREQIWDLKIDTLGILWIAGTRGLMSLKNDSWSSYNVENGSSLRELRVVLPFINKVYVGGHGTGIGILDRENIVPPIRIEIRKPIIDYEYVHFDWDADAMWGAIRSENIGTRYKIDNNKWSAWSEDKYLKYITLSGGEHSLFVQARDNYGTIRSNVASITFFVPYPLYLRLEYLIPIIILLFIIIYLIYRHMKYRILNSKIMFAQKTRISNDLHDEVGSNLGSIALISQRISKNNSLTKKNKNDLIVISETAVQTAEYIRDIVWYINPRFDSKATLESRMRETAGRMLPGLDIQFQVNDIVQTEFESVEYRRNLFLMYKEILHNINKHSKATKVNILFDRKESYIKLNIKDNGIGFDQNLQYAGNGMHSLKKRAEEMGAKLDITSANKNGTSINIMIRRNVKTQS